MNLNNYYAINAYAVVAVVNKDGQIIVHGEGELMAITSICGSIETAIAQAESKLGAPYSEFKDRVGIAFINANMGYPIVFANREAANDY